MRGMKFFGLFVVVSLIWLVVGCGEELPTGMTNINPDAGPETREGGPSYVIFEDTLQARLPDQETLEKWAEEDLENGPVSVDMAPAAVSTVWYQTNAVFTRKGQSGVETKEGYSVSGKISFDVAPSGLTGVDSWIRPKQNSSSGQFYPYLKLNGQLPTHVDGDKLYFKVKDDGTASWVAKGTGIYTHIIVFENSGVSSSTTMYVRGNRSTAGQWQRMDYQGNYRWQYDPVLVSMGREALEFKDGSGKLYRFTAIVDNIRISYYDPNNNYLPTFEYTSTGIHTLGSNEYVLDILVADGEPPSPPPDGQLSRQPFIEGTLLKIEGQYLIDRWGQKPSQGTRVYMLGDMLDGNEPGSGWGWNKRSTQFSGTVGSRWLEISLTNLPEGNTYFNLSWGDGRWLVWDQDVVRDSYLWVDTAGGKVLGIRSSGNTFSKIY